MRIFVSTIAVVLCLVLVLSVLDPVVAKQQQHHQQPEEQQDAPSCNSDDKNTDDSAPSSCPLYWWPEGNWFVPGKNGFRKGQVIGFPRDIVINFVQQSRRGFVGWNRYYHLYGHVVNKQQQRPAYHFTYAPASEFLECHARLYNVQLNTTTFVLTANRHIAPWEPIFVECVSDNLSVDVQLQDFPQLSVQQWETQGHCLHKVELRDAKNDKVVAVYAKQPLPAGDVIISGDFVHMHRAEFYNETAQTNEPLIQYTYGHGQTDLLLLPNFPIVSSIRHGRPANVALQWGKEMDVTEIFTSTSQVLFVEAENAFLDGELVALKDIAAGEELLLDYGDAYEKSKSDGKDVILQERTVPNGFFPDEWLAKERRQLASEMPQFALPRLEPYQVAPITLQDGSNTKISDHLHRVGMPDSIADTMESWADEIGLLDHLKRYVFDKSLDIDAEERVRINNGTWWAKRFDSEWQSNMHYTAVDDDESAEQMFHALHRGGFDKVLDAIGRHFDLDTLTCFYPSYIVVNHCVKSYVHSDSDYPNIFNMIFPVVQFDNGEPELVLGSDDTGGNYTPYVYERNAAVLLGMDGMHGTAATDYRDSGGVRIVVSVYMGDFSKDDDDVQQYIEDWQDPPYPTYYDGQLHHNLVKVRHWSKDDPSLSLGMPHLREFPLERPRNPKDQLLQPKQD